MHNIISTLLWVGERGEEDVPCAALMTMTTMMTMMMEEGQEADKGYNIYDHMPYSLSYLNHRTAYVLGFDSE